MKHFSIFFLKKFSGSKLLFIISTPLLALFMNLKELLLGLSILIFIDLVTGIVKYCHVKKIKLRFRVYKSIKSDLLRKTMKKSYEYGIMIIVGILLEEILFEQTILQIQDKKISISQISIIMPIGIEIWSIFENIEEVTDNNVLKRVFSFLPKKFQRILNSKEVEDKKEK